jgi:glycosyltransferase involved in cell wall biosynthesis
MFDTFSIPFFSIIMPSYLGEYPNAASNRQIKFRRAIESVLSQSFTNFELIIIADGCTDTLEIAQDYYDDRIKCFYMKKQKPFSGAVRTMGIQRSKGEYVCYLDTDDYFKINHLEFIKEGIEKNNKPNFIHFADNLNSGEMAFGRMGTSNICHENNKKYFWPDDYNHDWKFILTYFYPNGIHIGQSGYMVCHIPGKMDE